MFKPNKMFELTGLQKFKKAHLSLVVFLVN